MKPFRVISNLVILHYSFAMSSSQKTKGAGKSKKSNGNKRPKADFKTDSDRAQVIEFIKENEAQLFGQNLDKDKVEKVWKKVFECAKRY